MNGNEKLLLIPEEEENDFDEKNMSVQSSDEDSDWDAEEDEDEADLENEDSDSPSNTSSLDDLTGYDRVLDLLKGGRDLQALKVDECKTYLRKHGLRITGTKEVCIQRIQEHWRIKDGNGEELYSRSSFTINCTGDVCRGDIVLFNQRVYEKFDKVTRTGKILGRRTIAGRIITESYGAAKHQHTFTIEVLWSKGAKKLPPMFPLLVKGRNLYRLRTFRQPWHNEAERSNVLAEKHIRGTKARNFRGMKKGYLSNRGAKRKRSQQTTSSQKSYKIQESGAVGILEKRKNDVCHAKTQNLRAARMKRVAKHSDPGSCSKHLHTTDSACYPYTFNCPPSNYNVAMQSNPRDVTPVLEANRGTQIFSNYETGSTTISMTKPPLLPELQCRGYNSSYYTLAGPKTSSQFGYNPVGTSTSCQFNPRRLNRWPDCSSTNMQLHAINSGIENYRRHANAPKCCSTPGCRDLRAENCVSLSCRRCCRTNGMRCLRHHT